MSGDLWRRYVDALSGSAVLEGLQAEHRRALEASLEETRDDVESQHRTAVARVERLSSDVDRESQRIRMVLSSAGVPSSVGGASVDADTSAVDAEEPGELLDHLRGLVAEIERQSSTLSGILRVEQRAEARAEEEASRRAVLAERARARQDAMDQARQEATRRRQSDSAPSQREPTPPVANEPATQPAVPGGWKVSLVIWVIMAVVVIAVVLALVLL